MKLSIYSIHKTLVLRDDVEQVTLQTAEGEITILEHHMPLISLVAKGDLQYTHSGETETIALEGGVLEIQEDGRVVVLAHTPS